MAELGEGPGFRVEIEVSLADGSALVDPFFRFRLPTGDKVVTAPLASSSELSAEELEPQTWSTGITLDVDVPDAAFEPDPEPDADPDAPPKPPPLARVAVRLQPADTVAEAAAKVAAAEQCGLAPEDVELFFGGGPLDFGATLASYRLQDGDVLLARPREPEEEALGAKATEEEIAAAAKAAKARAKKRAKLPAPPVPELDMGVLHRWSGDFGMAGGASPDADFARLLNEQPFVTFALADATAGGAATAALTDEQSEAATEAAAREAADAAAVAEAEAPAGGEDAAAAAAAVAPVETAELGRNFVDLSSLDLSALLAPGCGQRSVSLVAAQRGAGNAELALPLPPAGLARLVLRVTWLGDEPLLDEATAEQLNPLEVRLKRAVDLPGVRVTSTADREFIEPTPYRLLREHCQPTFAVCRLFDSGGPAGDGWGVDSTGALGGRVLMSACVPQAQSVSFELRSTFLTGDLDQVALLERLSAGVLRVEVHDRDVMDDEWRAAAVRRWERLLVGGHHLVEGEIEAIEKDREGERAQRRLAREAAREERAAEAAVARAAALETAGGDEAAAQSDADAAAAEAEAAAAEDAEDAAWEAELEDLSAKLTEEVDVFDAIDVARTQGLERAWSAGQRGAHSVTTFRLAGLLDKAPAQRRAFLKRTQLNAGEAAKDPMAATVTRNFDGVPKDVDYLAKTGQGVFDASGTLDLAATMSGTWDGGGGGGGGGTASSMGAMTMGASMTMGGGGGAAGPAPVSLVRAKMKGGLAQAKRRKVPKGVNLAELDWTAAEKVVRQPGDFAMCGSQLAVELSLTRPVVPGESLLDAAAAAAEAEADTEEDTEADKAADEASAKGALFTRMAIVFEYHNAPMLRAVLEAMDTVNRRALPDPELSLRSHQLTEREARRAARGSLDVVCGFTVIDDHYRMVVLEGLAESGLGHLAASVTKLREQNSWQTRMLWNPQARFKARLYSCFSVDLKKIKLRNPLPILAKSPSIYMRSVVTETCFEGLHRLVLLREANRMLELAHMDVFPTPAMILQVENRYGESISVQDIDGSQPKVLKPVPSGTWRPGMTESGQVLPDPADDEVGEQTGGPAAFSAGGARGISKLHQAKAALDMSNAAYLEARANWRPTDYTTEHRDMAVAMRRAARSRFAASQAELRAADEAAARDGGPKTFVYSGQALQHTLRAQREMAARLSKDTCSTYTYSRDFQSLAAMMVDEDKMARDAALESASRWMTGGGFLYPPARTPQELITHPKQLSESRRTDLRVAWVENELHPKPVSRSGKLAPGQKEFDAIPSKDLALFANNKELFGADFFQSVFLGGDGLAKEIADLKAKEKRTFEEKLVVDSILFTAHGSTMGQVDARNNAPSQLDKCRDTLDGEAQSKSIRIVRNARLPSGKKVPLRALKPGCINTDAYEDPPDFATSFRAEEPIKWTTRNAETGRPINFKTQIHRLALVPPSNKTSTKYMRLTDEGVQKRDTKEMTAAEMTGTRWAESSRLRQTRREQGLE